MSSLLELLKAKGKAIAASSGNRQKTIKPAPGTGRYRVLPSWRGAGQQFWHDFGQHFIKNATGDITAIYMCTDKTYGRPCAVCDAISQGTRAASDDATMEILKQAKSSGRTLLNVLHLDGPEGMRATPQILELSQSAFNAVIAISTEWEEAGDSIFDAVKGKDILITREGSGLKTKYAVQVAAKSAPIPEACLSQLVNLDDYVAQESSEAQNRALNSVRSVTGLLPAPVRSGLPAAAAGAATFADVPDLDDPYAAAPTPPKKVAAAPAAAVTDVAAKPVKAAAPAAADSTGDADLDDLLNQLS